MLGPAIGDLLPIGVGVALSPIPVIMVILVLSTPRARTNGPAFALGWVVGLVAVAALAYAVGSSASDPDSGSSTLADVVRVVLGLLFFALAVKQWRSRPAPGTEAELPAWMSSVDQLTPAKTLGGGLALSAANPKNLALTIAATATVVQADLGGGDAAIALGVFVLVGSISVLGAVVANLVAAERVAQPLAVVKGFMSQNNAVIMMVVLALLGTKMLGQGLGSLLA